MKELILDCKNEYWEPLSNYSDYSFFLDEMSWRSVAHYYHFNKFDKFISKRAILFSRTAKEAEEIGQKRYQVPKGIWQSFKQRGMNPGFKENWKELRYDVMKKAIYAKVLYNYPVRKILFETDGNRLLVDADSRYWGYQNNGENKLGEALMEIRADLLKGGKYDDLEKMMLPPWLQYPNVYAGFWKQGVGEFYMMEFVYWDRGLSPSSKLIYEEQYPAPPKEEQMWYYIYHPREEI